MCYKVKKMKNKTLADTHTTLRYRKGDILIYVGEEKVTPLNTKNIPTSTSFWIPGREYLITGVNLFWPSYYIKGGGHSTWGWPPDFVENPEKFIQKEETEEEYEQRLKQLEEQEAQYREEKKRIEEEVFGTKGDK